MSRGLGRVQVGLLAIIEQHEKPLNTYRLARMFYQPNVEGSVLTMAQVKATYRALCSLEKRGNARRIAANIAKVPELLRSNERRS